jgi:hypothetical protein
MSIVTIITLSTSKINIVTKLLQRSYVLFSSPNDQSISAMKRQIKFAVSEN